MLIQNLVRAAETHCKPISGREEYLTYGVVLPTTEFVVLKETSVMHTHLTRTPWGMGFLRVLDL